ncbi:beta strand repeat-containing protein, partial [Daejeonella sp.]|uniref:beta strand repeat-containing protein n=1 Tax=Daejeonella sp. TaxID=2805397 RepID=UPI00378320F3
MANSQTLISVSFNNGAIGVQGTNPQQLNSLQSFQSLQVSKAFFIQNSSTNQFFAQGNDIPGTLRLVTTSNQFLDVAGAIVWREGNNGSFIGFIPNPTNAFSTNLNTVGGANYTINQNSNFAIVYNNKSFTFTSGTLRGDAATSSVLNDLNDYLAIFNAARPAGPVTVTPQTTASTTPTITGTATLGSGETLSIEFNGVVYTTASGVAISGNTWSFTVPSALSAGTYSVVATITKSGGYSLSDNTNEELIISSVNFASLGCITIVASGGDAVGSTWNYANNTITPTSSTAVSLNVSDVLAKMASGNLKIESNCIIVNSAVTNSSNASSLTLGRVGSTNTVVINAPISTAGSIISYANLITTNSNLTSSAAATISLLANSGLRFGNAGITLQSQGGNLILSSDYDANSNGNIISEGALTLTSNGGAIRLGGGSTGTDFAYGTGNSNLAYDNQNPGIWVKGAVNINSGNGDISIKGYAANASPTIQHATAWGVGLGLGSSVSSPGNAVSINSGSGKIFVEGWARNPTGSNSNSFGVVFNNWEGITTQPLTISSANTTADAITLIGNTQNTINGQRYKNSLRFFSDATSITATGAGGGITLSAKTFAGNDHPQIAWAGGNILAASGPITINSEKGALYLEGDLYLGSKSGVTGNTSSTSTIRLSLDNYIVASGKQTRIASTGQATIEPFEASFKDYLSIVQSFTTATGWAFNQNSQTLTGLTIGKPLNNSDVTLANAATVAGPITAYGNDVTVSGALASTASGSDVLVKSSRSAIVTANITTNGGDITIWTDSDANGTGGIRVNDNVDLDSRTQTDRTASTNTTGGGKISLAGGLDDAGAASGAGTLTTGLTSGDGYPDGYAVNSGSTVTQSGIVLGTSTSATGHNANINLLSGGGHVRLHGLVTSNNNSNGPTGILAFHGHTINAGTSGDIVLLGNAAVTIGQYAFGLDLAAWRENSYTASEIIRTVNGNISVIGRASGGTAENIAIAIDGKDDKRNIFAATGSGTITFNGLATGTAARDFRITNADILSASGVITLQTEGSTGIAVGGYNIGDGLFLGQKAGSLVTASTSNIVLKTNALSTTNKPIDFNTSGTVTIEPFGTSFGAAQSISNVTFANTITSLTLGKSTNTAGITLASPATIAGPVTMHGGALAINSATTATNSNINLHATGAVSQTAALTANGLGLHGTGTFALTNTGNNVATIAGGDNSNKLGSLSYVDASGGLTIGTVNPTGIYSTGVVLIETLSGNLTLSENVATTNTTANAITLNAGKSTAIGTATGGDIIVSGTPTLTTGTGGIARLFSGSEASSTNLTTLVGGSSNRRNEVDETSGSFSPVLAANNSYALYREALICSPLTAPTAPATQLFCPGATVVTLVATAGSGETIQWFTAPTGGTALATSASLTSGIYYAEAINSNNCVSPRTAVTVATNNALHFDGTDDKVNLTSTSLQDGATAFTIEAWIKPDNSNWDDRYHAIFGNQTSGDANSRNPSFYLKQGK